MGCVLQAQLLDMRSELVEERAAKDALQAELHTMLLQLHSTQLQMHEVKGLEVDSNDIKRKLVSAAFCRRPLSSPGYLFPGWVRG